MMEKMNPNSFDLSNRSEDYVEGFRAGYRMAVRVGRRKRMKDTIDKHIGKEYNGPVESRLGVFEKGNKL